MTADHVFGGDVSRMYQELLVPMIFEDAASEVAARAAAAVPSGGGAVLEVAAGTGAVTRAMCSALPASTAITATDLNQAMLDRALAVGTGGREVRWQQADVMALPFDDASFDVVVCQFGAMFFPDRPAAFSEIHRVLRGGGRLLCSVW